jgi:hypothetical protein
MSWWERQLRTYFKGAISVSESTIADGDILSYDSTNKEWSPTGAWANYVPSLSASGSMTYTASGGGISLARWCRIGNIVFLSFYIEGTTGGTANNRVIISLPANSVNDNLQVVMVAIRDATSGTSTNSRAVVRTAQLDIYKPDTTNWGLGTGRLIFGNIFYEAA